MRPDPGEGCTGTAPAICATKMRPNEVGTIGAGYVWDVVADRPGIYEITASVEPTEPDPDLSNNTDTFRFEVVQPTSRRGWEPAGGRRRSIRVGERGQAHPGEAKGRLARLGDRARYGRRCARQTYGDRLRRHHREREGQGHGQGCKRNGVVRLPHAEGGEREDAEGTVSFTARGTKFTKRFSARLG